MSAHDRARTIAVAIADATGPADHPPGPAADPARVDGGARPPRHTEAAVDLARLADSSPPRDLRS
jgi:3,4-dihydroxy-2-butanone 4-phosphate synthase